MSKSLPTAGRQMSNECQISKFCSSTLSGLIIIKAKALSYDIWALAFDI